MSTVCCVT